METLGSLQLNNKELILKLKSKRHINYRNLHHLKALYEEQWGDAEATAPQSPGEISMEEDNETDYAQQTNIEEKWKHNLFFLKIFSSEM